MTKYIVIQNNRVIGFYNSFNDAIEAVIEIGGGEIYRAELIAKLSEEETHSLRDIVLTTSTEPVEAPVVSRKPVVSRNAIVLDRVFSEEHAVKLMDKYSDFEIYLLTTSKKGFEKRNNLIYIGVESSLDVCSFIEDLVSQNYRVFVFTSDKKLYTHLSKKTSVRVFYKLIEEYSSVDELIESMNSDIQKTLKG